MLKLTFAIVPLLALTACQTLPNEPGVPYPLSAAERAQIVATESAGLMDPYSAHFSRIGATRHADGFVMVCGLVNARNAYGAFVGNRAFQGSIEGGRYQHGQVGISPAYSAAIAGHCREVGIPL